VMRGETAVRNHGGVLDGGNQKKCCFYKGVVPVVRLVVEIWNEYISRTRAGIWNAWVGVCAGRLALPPRWRQLPPVLCKELTGAAACLRSVHARTHERTRTQVRANTRSKTQFFCGSVEVDRQTAVLKKCYSCCRRCICVTGARALGSRAGGSKWHCKREQNRSGNDRAGAPPGGGPPAGCVEGGS
jgi:hypothetical protein